MGRIRGQEFHSGQVRGQESHTGQDKGTGGSYWAGKGTGGSHWAGSGDRRFTMGRKKGTEDSEYAGLRVMQEAQSGQETRRTGSRGKFTESKIRR